MAEQAEDSGVIAGRDVMIDPDSLNAWYGKLDEQAKRMGGITVNYDVSTSSIRVDKTVRTDCVIEYVWVDETTVQAACTCGATTTIQASRTEPIDDYERRINENLEHNLG